MISPRASAALSSLLLAFAACGGSNPATTSSSSGSGSSATSTSGTGGAPGTGSGGASTASSGSNGSGGSSGAGGSCVRVAGPADGPRHVVVTHPSDAQGNPSGLVEVLALDTTGALSKTGQILQLGPTSFGEVVFTPDGKIAIAVEDDGTLGVLRFDDQGTAHVVHASFHGSFYAQQVVIDPSGENAFVLDPDYPTSTGGLYRIAIGCDGSLTDLGRVAPSKTARALLRLGQTPDHAVLAAVGVLSSPAGDDVHLLDLSGATPAVLGSVQAFPSDASSNPDEAPDVSAIARTEDDAFVLVGDNSEFSSFPNGVAVVSVAGATVVAAPELTTIMDPVAIVASPFGGSVLVASGLGNAFLELGYAPAATPAFTLKGEITYVGQAPQLPGSAVKIDRGSLRGRVYVAELSGVRQLVFTQPSGITDLGLFDFGAALENMVGALGVSP